MTQVLTDAEAKAAWEHQQAESRHCQLMADGFNEAEWTPQFRKEFLLEHVRNAHEQYPQYKDTFADPHRFYLGQMRKTVRMKGGDEYRKGDWVLVEDSLNYSLGLIGPEAQPMASIYGLRHITAGTAIATDIYVIQDSAYGYDHN